MARKISQGSIALTKVNAMADDIATLVGKSDKLVHNWRKGWKRPLPPQRARLFDLYGIPPSAWDEPAPAAPVGGFLERVAQLPAPVAQAEARRQLDSVPADPGGGTIPTVAGVDAKAFELMARVNRLIDETERDPTGSPLGKARTLGVASRILRDLDNIVGVNLSPARIIRAHAFRHVLDEIKAAVRLHPEAVVAIDQALQGLE